MPTWHTFSLQFIPKRDTHLEKIERLYTEDIANLELNVGHSVKDTPPGCKRKSILIEFNDYSGYNDVAARENFGRKVFKNFADDKHIGKMISGDGDEHTVYILGLDGKLVSQAIQSEISKQITALRQASADLKVCESGSGDDQGVYSAEIP